MPATEDHDRRNRQGRGAEQGHERDEDITHQDLTSGGTRSLPRARAQGWTILPLGQDPLGKVQSILEFAELGLLTSNVRLDLRQG